MLVTHESIRNWCRKFGPEFAKRLRRRRRQPGDTWHLDEVFVRIRGMLHYIWRAVGSARGRAGHSSAGETRWCGRQTLSQAPAARPAIQTKRLVTDSLRSYGVAHRTLLPDIKHRTSPYRNNRAENSHRPTRRRERQMQRFKSRDQAQDFLSAHAIICGHFRSRRHRLGAVGYRRVPTKAFRT